MSPQAGAGGQTEARGVTAGRSERRSALTCPTPRAVASVQRGAGTASQTVLFPKSRDVTLDLSHCHLEIITSQLHRGWGLALGSSVTVPLRHLHTHTLVPRESALPMADIKIDWHTLDTGRGDFKPRPPSLHIWFPPLQHSVLPVRTSQNQSAVKALSSFKLHTCLGGSVGAELRLWGPGRASSTPST